MTFSTFGSGVLASTVSPPTRTMASLKRSSFCLLEGLLPPVDHLVLGVLRGLEQCGLGVTLELSKGEGPNRDGIRLELVFLAVS